MSIDLIRTNRANYPADTTVLPGIQRIEGEVTVDGPIEVLDIINGAGVQGNLTFSTTAVVARVGGSNLANRVVLTIHALNAGIYWGYTSAVTVATGTPLQNGETFIINAGPNRDVYVIGNSGTKNVRITEGAAS